MGLFNRNNEEEQKRPVNPNNMVLIRLLAIGYLMYCLYEMFKMYITGGEDAPALWLLIGATVLFVGGSVWIAIITWRQFKRMKAEQLAAWEEEERLEAEAQRLAESEEEYRYDLQTDTDDEEENEV